MSATSLPFGVCLEPLRVIATEGGPVLHMLRNDSPLYKSFGEAYFSELLPGYIKGWKRHKLQTQHLCVPVGQAVFVLHDLREGSSSYGESFRLVLGRPENYSLLVIPPMIWYAFACSGTQAALVANCADLPHDPTESERLPLETQAFPLRLFKHN